MDLMTNCLKGQTRMFARYVTYQNGTSASKSPSPVYEEDEGEGEGGGGSGICRVTPVNC